MASLNSGNSFEEAMARLEAIVTALEMPDISLEEGMKLYQEGSQCARFCREKLDKARHQLEIWQNDRAEPVDTEADLEDPEPEE